ncbi:uncharacterized protein N7477_007915 [Penicillium maclennaniae]|uniref:uncharacterized protein n=1 Tax=Penicillium maclennaniae TaxID=1343394 RepID=UPI00254066FF|nr:uncharacterized protein N7477_007915 [Penicillium maclennaniae]KAJ5665467.1 hypothetical protein N7477_007915 [Penicillium maclennaniae]
MTDNISELLLPTWLVLRDHKPIEYDKSEDNLTQINDEEQKFEQLDGITGKWSIIVGETRMTK